MVDKLLGRNKDLMACKKNYNASYTSAIITTKVNKSCMNGQQTLTIKATRRRIFHSHANTTITKLKKYQIAS